MTAKASCHQEAKLALQTSQDPGVMTKGFDWTFLVAHYLCFHEKLFGGRVGITFVLCIS